MLLEEVVCNVMDYAVPADGCGTLEIHLRMLPEGWRLLFRDDGPAYDPLSRDAPDLDAPLAERDIGGLGIHLVRTLAREAVYAHRDGWNELTLLLGDPAPVP